MNRLKELLAKVKTDHIYIQTHKFPDPDAIASAYAMQRLLEYHDIRSEICYGGFIDFSSTRRMTDYLGIEMKNTASMDLSCPLDTVLSVDSQPVNENSSGLQGRVSLCIDHHQSFETAVCDYEDIRPDYGACASIIWEYYRDDHVPVDTRIATALVYGMQIDTDNFTRGTISADVDAFDHLFPHCDKPFLNLLHKSKYDRKGITAFGHSFNHLEIRGDICFVDVGNDCPDALVAKISDFVTDIEGINIALVFSRRENGMKFSMRSVSPQYDTGILMRAILRGYGQGGGHEIMAGGFVPNREGLDWPKMIEEIKQKLVKIAGMICQ